MSTSGGATGGGGGSPTGPAGGDLAGTYPNPTLNPIGSATGPLGTAARTNTVTIDTKGRVTALTDQAISGAGIDSTAVHTSDYPITVAHGGTGLSAAGAAGTAVISDDGTVDAYNYPSNSGCERVVLPSTAIAVTMPRWVPCGTAQTVVQNGLFVVPIWLPKSTLCTSITYAVAASVAAPTHQVFGLYDNAKALLRATSDDTSTAWSAAASKTLNLTSTFTTTYTGQYWLAITVTCTTSYSLSTTTASTTGIVNLGAARWGVTSDVTLNGVLPNPFGTITQAAQYPLGAIS